MASLDSEESVGHSQEWATVHKTRPRTWCDPFIASFVAKHRIGSGSHAGKGCGMVLRGPTVPVIVLRLGKCSQMLPLSSTQA